MKAAIVGAGKLGTGITRALAGGGNEISVLDADEQAITKIQNAFDVMALCEDARKTSVLKDLHIETYNCLIACADSDEKNIFISSMAKKLGCPLVISRVREPEHVDQLDLIRENFGIDTIVNPDYSCAVAMYEYLTEKYGIAGGNFSIGKAGVREIGIERMPELEGKTLREASLPEGTLLAAVSRSGKIIIPNGSTRLAAGDHLYFAGPQDKLTKLSLKLANGSSKEDKLRRVMIAGGGKTTHFLAQMLEDAGIAVKIIEIDRARCEYLAEKLTKSLVLHGDASDLNLLAEEKLDAMDAFIAATGFNEENILLSLLAHKHHVKDVIAKVSNNAFGTVTDDMDGIMTINPVDMCTSSVLQTLNSTSSVTFTKMIQGQAEFVEVQAEEGMPLTAGTLKDITIPEGVLIATVYRGSDLIIPAGSTQILPGDKVMILSMLTRVGELEGLLNKGKASHSL